MTAVIGSNSIPPEDARRLISAHDGNVALLYIWQSMNGRFDAEAAARDLCMTAGEVTSAKEKLDRLFSSVSPETSSPSTPSEAKPETAIEKPQYTKEDLDAVLSSGNEFASVIEETRRILGRPLSPTEMSTLLAIYDHLGMPAEVMMELVNYCSEISRERFGESRRLPVREIYKEASRWAGEGILSFEAAERYIDEQKRLKSRTSEIAAVLKLDPGRVTSTPLGYIESWASMGFDNLAIAEAYDRTFTKTGALSWKYMDAILKKWHEAGLHRIKEIIEKDGRKSRSGPQTGTKSGSVNSKAVKDLFKDSKNKG